MGFLNTKSKGPAPSITHQSGPKIPSISGTAPQGTPIVKGGPVICPHCGKDTTLSPERPNQDLVRHMLNELDKAEGMSVWEDKFCADMEKALEKYGSLTPKQFGVLQRIYDERVQ